MRFLGIGFELAGVIAVMAWIGYGIDRWQDSAPWGVVIGSMIGITGGLYNLIKEVIRDNR